MININHITAGYGDKVVLNDISTTIDPSKITVIMGPNGCGKTTLLKTIMGLIKPMSGEVVVGAHNCAQIKGRNYAPLQKFIPSPREWIKHGVFMIGQGQRVFPSMSVRENIEIATHWWGSVGALGCGRAAHITKRKAFGCNKNCCIRPIEEGVCNTPLQRSDFEKHLDHVLKNFPDLRERLDDAAGNLSGGQQQMVALARGLINRPKCLLLDEPSIGLAPKLISDTFRKLREINQNTNTGFVIVEHNLKTLLPLTDNAIILAQGKIAYDGKSDGKTLQNMIDKIF